MLYRFHIMYHNPDKPVPKSWIPKWPLINPVYVGVSGIP